MPTGCDALALSYQAATSRQPGRCFFQLLGVACANRPASARLCGYFSGHNVLRPFQPTQQLLNGHLHSVQVLDVVYANRPIERFWFLETVARMPYFVYISMVSWFPLV